MHLRMQTSRGFSLIEVMVSITLGILVLGMVVQLFINTKQNHVQNDRIVETLENGRFALRQIANDLKSAGYLGGIVDMSALKLDTTIPNPLTNDCGTTSETNWAYNINTHRSIQFKYNASASDANTQHKCIATTEFKPNTDLLAVKRVYNQTATGGLAFNNIYLRSDYNNACLWLYTSTNTSPGSSSNCPTTGYEDWLYLTHVYYIRPYAQTAGDGIPTLCRKALGVTSSGTPTPTMNTLCLAEGIEHFHVEYGIDTDTQRDGVADTFKSSFTTTAELEMLKSRAVSAKIFVLARALKEDPIFTNTKTYTMGSRTYTVNDKYYRRMYTTTVVLRNPTYMAQFNDY